ncbi:MAG TPA: hypothetical protein DCL41_00300 [Bdellovibrionales bacterium]|nr:hypothetical protein [Pseudobdellovibrionaceae bacterium]HAG90278.1 hypothetical protein [Bdellovibrionales bacterium]|tara:strand:+ start:163 stop:387 length:225 start_codon:yes stop_codon:yes gene_type:complete
MKNPAKPINEPQERLSATLEEHIKTSTHKHDRNPGARLVRRIFKPVRDWVTQIEKNPFGREALGFVALMTSPRP